MKTVEKIKDVMKVHYIKEGKKDVFEYIRGFWCNGHMEYLPVPLEARQDGENIVILYPGPNGLDVGVSIIRNAQLINEVEGDEE